jgi:Ser-tRNA(Ala) deacylase AlaX
MQNTTFYDKPYATEDDAEVVDVVAKGANTLLELDQTIFYPEGGGQPSDQGEIVGPNGRLKVDFVQNKGGTILHQGKLTGTIQVGDRVHLSIKWNHRHQNMRVHTAGHLIHDVLLSMTHGLVPLKGNHGSKAWLEYQGELDSGLKDELERAVNEKVALDLPVRMSSSSLDEITATCQFVPPGLPKDKPLRVLQIGEFSPMPDGGVHVRSTREIGKVVVQDIACTDGKSTIKYRVTSGD